MSPTEKDKARRWVKMWGTFSTSHKAKLGNDGYQGGTGRR